MKKNMLVILPILFLYACGNGNSVFKKNRNMEFNCENDFKVRFTESLTVTNGDSTEKITVEVNSPNLSKEYDMQQVRAASGVKYATKDGKTIFWEHQGEFTFGIEDSIYCLCK